MPKGKPKPNTTVRTSETAKTKEISAAAAALRQWQAVLASSDAQTIQLC